MKTIKNISNNNAPLAAIDKSLDKMKGKNYDSQEIRESK